MKFHLILTAAFLSLVLGVQALEQETLDKLKLPGIKIDAANKTVDVDAVICLDEGALELIACTKDTKEHESIVMVESKAVHIHMAMLLIGAAPGNPAMQQEVGEGEQKRWVFFPARGQPVRVSVVYKDEQGNDVVKPINEFLQKIDQDDPVLTGVPRQEEKPQEKFPTNVFLFMGSHLIGNGEGPRRYLAEESGNVITIATFGDEMLGLPENHSHANGELTWEINSEVTPAVGTKVKLRLAPVFEAPKEGQPEAQAPEAAPAAPAPAASEK